MTSLTTNTDIAPMIRELATSGPLGAVIVFVGVVALSALLAKWMAA